MQQNPSETRSMPCLLKRFLDIFILRLDLHLTSTQTNLNKMTKKQNKYQLLLISLRYSNLLKRVSIRILYLELKLNLVLMNLNLTYLILKFRKLFRRLIYLTRLLL